MRRRLIVTDAATQRPLPVRLSFHGSGVAAIWGRDAAGQDLTYLGPPRIWCDGDWEGDLPDVPLTVSISHLYEYVTQQIQLAPDDEEETHTILLERHCCPGSEGWVAGDAHQHVVHGEAELAINLPLAAAVSRAEGVSWMVYDARFTSVQGEAEPGVDEKNRLCAEASNGDFLALWADEYPKHDLGHLAAFPLREPADLPDVAGAGIYSLEDGMRTPFLNFESIRVLHRHGSTALYSHPVRELGGTPGRVGNISRELPLDAVVAPWALDSIDLFTDQIGDPLCFDMWYMLLNDGHRIGVCAFNDACFDRSGEKLGFHEPVAYRRTYVKVEDPLQPQALVEGIRTGRTFGTTGPIVLIDIDGAGPGHVYESSPTPRTLKIRAWAAPDYLDPATDTGISRIQVIRNGQMLKEWTFDGSTHKQVELEEAVAADTTAWYVVRVEGSAPDQLAITSPVYFEASDYTPPMPYAAAVHATVIDARTSLPLDGRLQIVAFDKEQTEVLDTMPFEKGHLTCSLRGDLRLRAIVDGYQDMILSPILDCEEIYRDIMGGIRREDLADPAYLDRLRAALDHVELSFPMERTTG